MRGADRCVQVLRLWPIVGRAAIDGNLAVPFPWPLYLRPRNDIYPKLPAWTDTELAEGISVGRTHRFDHVSWPFAYLRLSPITESWSMIENPVNQSDGQRTRMPRMRWIRKAMVRYAICPEDLA